jgi:hypothetical protein
VKEPNFRCGTRKAIDELAKELNLPNNEWMQDWPFEVIVPADIQKYIEHYQNLSDEDKKFVLMEGIIQATEEQPTEELFTKYWNIIKLILENDFHIHEYTLHDWACFDSKNLDECWRIAPLLRQFWTDNKKIKLLPTVCGTQNGIENKIS